MGLRCAGAVPTLPRMSALIAPLTDGSGASERHRRLLLAEADSLLARVEELRLAGRRTVPPALCQSLRSLQLRLGRVDAGHPRSVRAAQHLVYAVQARLMATNPR